MLHLEIMTDVKCLLSTYYTPATAYKYALMKSSQLLFELVPIRMPILQIWEQASCGTGGHVTCARGGTKQPFWLKSILC